MCDFDHSSRGSLAVFTPDMEEGEEAEHMRTGMTGVADGGPVHSLAPVHCHQVDVKKPNLFLEQTRLCHLEDT